VLGRMSRPFLPHRKNGAVASFLAVTVVQFPCASLSRTAAPFRPFRPLRALGGGLRLRQYDASMLYGGKMHLRSSSSRTDVLTSRTGS
jgi:hypothetical protein